MTQKKSFLHELYRFFSGGAAICAFVLSTGCDLNPLGGAKSNLGENFEPGKHTESAPPTIAMQSSYIIDENDTQSIPFTINDPDTFMVCSFVFVKATSSNDALIDSTGLVIGGTYPNCTLQITPKAFQFGSAEIKVDLYDFWTHAIANLNLTVVHILTPGAFLIIDAEGDDRSVTVTWQNAAYMALTGAYTSPYYTLFYRPVGSPSWTSLERVTSPYKVTGLTNGQDYDFYVNARNSIGNRNSNTVQATPTRYKLRGPEFISGSTQYENSAGTGTNVQIVNSTLIGHIDTPDSNYPVLNNAAPEIPVNGNFPVGSVKGSSLTTPSGNYKVFVNSQGNILSGAQE
ncbi:MAG: hypothetical protein A2622_06925 [Bdellovibrionales bacterium RIFCSPHIGHO2_01_FULL_40_29]|nr:MAG: hypothetical protein A2622_06925 [Bdellovibrionales bacterium RIFCSPHIGHO2_01_FULL_40_29]